MLCALLRVPIVHLTKLDCFPCVCETRDVCVKERQRERAREKEREREGERETERKLRNREIKYRGKKKSG